ncbi:hypothetical protein BH10CYA1_BH10CYA1_36830 [soil metagenome]
MAQRVIVPGFVSFSKSVCLAVGMGRRILTVTFLKGLRNLLDFSPVELSEGKIQNTLLGRNNDYYY